MKIAYLFSKGHKKKDLAVQYGVSVSTISRMMNGKQAYRENRPVRKLSPCGTIGAYRRHIRYREVVDIKCSAANANYEMNRKRNVSSI